MKGGTKTGLILLLLLLTAGTAGGIWYVKQKLRQDRPANAPPVTQKEKSPTDLRPAAIAKLQSLVASGSDGLYKLRVDSLLTDLTSGTVLLKGVALYPDSAAIPMLHAQHKLPDDIFRITLASLRVSGIGLSDIVQRRDLHLRTIACERPQIVVHHKAQPYNADKRAAAKKETLFSRLNGSLDRLAIDNINLSNGTLEDYNGGQKNTYNDLSLALHDVLIDKTAEADKSRILFAKKALLQAGAITFPAGPKNAYDLHIGGIAVTGETQTLSIRDLAFRPRSGKEAFVRSLKEQDQVFDIRVPLVTLHGVDWWALAHGTALRASEVECSGARVQVYLDKRLPASPTINRANFPQQLLAEISTPISLKRVVFKSATIVYEEYTRRSNRQSSISFNNVGATFEGVTNVPAEVVAHPVAQVKGTCLFMNKAPMSTDLRFELPRNRRGAFTAALHMGAIDHSTVNLFSEGMGLVRFTSGQLEEATAQVAGTNDNVHGNLSARYNDLHLEPLKTKEHDDGRLKGKRITTKLANGVFVKNNNPAKGRDLRQLHFSLDRTKESNFFNLLWMGVKKGLLETIGVPPAFAM